MSPLVQILVIAFLVLALWGGFGYQRAGAPWVGAWSPFGFTAAVLLLLYLTGHLH